VIRVDGQLDGRAVPDLERLAATTGPESLSIDLSGLTSLDAAARRALVALSQRGCLLRGASLYIARVLADAETPQRADAGPAASDPPD
jgi:anti-anti-sigma regulatory factor